MPLLVVGLTVSDLWYFGAKFIYPEDPANFTDLASEEKVIEALASPMPRDELIRVLTLPVSDANVLLLGMELKGLIKETLGELRRNI